MSPAMTLSLSWMATLLCLRNTLRPFLQPPHLPRPFPLAPSNHGVCVRICVSVSVSASVSVSVSVSD